MHESTHAPTPIRWGDELLLGYAPMDHRHEEFVQVVSALQGAEPAQFAERLAAVRTHLQAHFDEEERWMKETQFPSADCHLDEHAAVIKSVLQVQELLADGDDSECLRLANALADWFPGHASYLDAPLSHWMCKKSTGGKPVIIRRNMQFD
jgi:hemerythrin